MEHSSEKTELHDQSYRVTCYPFCSPICHSLERAIVAILTFLGFKISTRVDQGKPCRPVSPPPEVPSPAGSDPPTSPADPVPPPTVLAERFVEARAFRRRVPRPPPSQGGGGQIN